MFCVAPMPVYAPRREYVSPGIAFDVDFRPQYDYRGCTHYRRPVFALDFDSAVERAAQEYVYAQSRVEALRRQRLEQARVFELRQQEQQRLVNAELASWLQQDLGTSSNHFLPGLPFVDELLARREAEVERQKQLQRLQEDRRRKAAAFHRQEQLKELERQAARREATLFAAQQQQLRRPSAPKHQPTQQDIANPRASLLRRLASEEDIAIQEVLDSLLAHLFDVQPSEPEPVVPKTEKKGKARETPAVPFPWTNTEQPAKKTVHFANVAPSAPAPTTEARTVAAADTQGADLHRAPAISLSNADVEELFARCQVQRQVSLDKIDSIRDSLQELQGSFVFPKELDFRTRSRSPSPAPSPLESDVEGGPLPFTHRNKPLLAYEHALNGLLSQLDDVASHGDEEIRNKRREVVVEVEKALGDIEKLVTGASPKLKATELSDDSVEVPSVIVSEVESLSVEVETNVLSADLAAASAESQQHQAASSNDNTPSLDSSSPVASSPDIQAFTVPLPVEEAVTLPGVPIVTEEESEQDVITAEPDDSSLAVEVVDIISSPVNRAPDSDEHVNTLSGDHLQSDPEPSSFDVSTGPAATNNMQQDQPAEVEVDTDLAATPASEETVPPAELEAMHPVDAAALSPSHSVEEDQPAAVPYLLQSFPLEDDESSARAKARATAGKVGDDVEWDEADVSVPSDADEDGWSELE